MPAIEDLVTEKEPDFYGFDDIFESYTPKKIAYFAKWMDLILLEEHTAFERARARAARTFATNELCLEWDNLIDVRLKKKSHDFVKKAQPIILNFVQEFMHDNDNAVEIFNGLRLDSKILLTHPKSKIRLSGILIHKDIRIKTICEGFTFKQFRVKVKCNSHHVNMQTERYLGRQKHPNIEKLSHGWIYKKRSYGYYSTMRANVVDLIAKPEHEVLSDYLVEGKEPKLETRPTRQEIKAQMGRHPVNEDQFKAIQRSLQTDSFSLILGMPGTGKTRTICIMIDLMIKMNKRVLVTSFTHVALDNIIDKFIEMFPR